MNIVTLSNGLKVANFSSPHPFIFEDGTILPAVSNKKANELMLENEEVEIFKVLNDISHITLVFRLNDVVREELELWKKQYSLFKVDVVLCPLPVIEAMREEKFMTIKNNYPILPFRTVRVVDRINKIVSINKFCM